MNFKAFVSASDININSGYNQRRYIRQRLFKNGRVFKVLIFVISANTPNQ